MMAPAASKSSEVSKLTVQRSAGSPRSWKGNFNISGRLGYGSQLALASRSHVTSAPATPPHKSALPARAPSPGFASAPAESVALPASVTPYWAMALRLCASIASASSGCSARSVSAAAMPDGNFNPSWLIICRFMGMAMKTPIIATEVIHRKMTYQGSVVCVAIISAGMAAAVPPPVM